MQITIDPIGHVRSTRAEVRDDDWDREVASIELDTTTFGPDALLGLQQFSHVEVLYCFDQVPESKIERGARRPRGNPDWPLVGIFAQRGKNRPNRLGATIAKIVRVEGTTLHVSGLDAVDGTPVVDLKPYMDEFGPRGAVTQPTWATELMHGYWDTSA
ncbi:SAM-dependent methyltransferase [Curtobacterium sp. 22159]|uniref:SAM-dependent methyltransferase n=1 Tax=Curtobacterium sp. 22159 TaxID=3453882 RepID=UPI003F85106F